MDTRASAEMERPEVNNGVRVLVRLKHSLPADAEIKTVLPDRLDEFEDALARGQLKESFADLDEQAH